jgi:hypothetical protein
MKLISKSTSVILIAILFLGSIAKAQEDENIIPKHYVFPTFIKGIVKLKDGRSQSTLLNYNKISQEIIFVSNGQNLALRQLETIDTVIIQNRKFIQHDKIFLELIVNEPISLFFQHKCRFKMVGETVGFGQSMISKPTKLSSLDADGMIYNLKLPENTEVDDISGCWIRKDNKFYSVEKDRDLRTVFPDKAAEIKTFFKANKLKLNTIEEGRKLVAFLNGLN